jgi:hypothetical protein
MTRKLTIEEFKNRFTERFPKKNFDFSKSNYINAHTLMKVECNNGHTFEVRPCDLMNGGGCPYCSGIKKLTKEDFIKDATFVHNGYFTYEHAADFTNVSSYVTVTCPIHGDFKVNANNHLNGANCKKCAKEGISHKITKREKVHNSTKKLSQYEFINKLTKNYGNKYIITDKTIYKGYNQKLILCCKEHGEFQITPSHLFSGRGCPYCGGNKPKTREEIIELINEAQPYADYDYECFDYNGIHTTSRFKCKKCGCYFYNSPSNMIDHHNGCPSCNGSVMEKEIKFLLEKHNIKFEMEKTFNWLVNKGHLYLDFYLTDYNIAIECQGKQHFEEVNFGCGKTLLKETEERDLIKNKLCKEHNIKVIYYANYIYAFPYKVCTSEEELLKSISLTNNNSQ